MIPFSIAEPEKELTIKKVGGNTEIRQHLENLGFTVGGTVTLINLLGENVIFSETLCVVVSQCLYVRARQRKYISLQAVK